MEIISPRETVHVEVYYFGYRWREGASGHGFSFDCDKDGNIDASGFCPEAIENLRKCQDGTYDVVVEGVRDFSYNYRQPAIGRCCCGEEVPLEHFTNACECGRDYDSSGNLLAPRSQWCDHGEGWNEDGTPETVADVLLIP